MVPLLVTAAGVLSIAAGVLVLRSFGPRYRVGRLLATAPRASIGKALDLAATGAESYVRLEGRIDAEAEFHDEHARPLVFRRARLEVRRGGRWQVVNEDRRSVPFVIAEGTNSIAVDDEALDVGLVVLAREIPGAAGDVPDLLPPATAPHTPVRARIEQLSSVEHVTVLGVPHRGSDGAAVIGPGRGRPLVVSALERDEAMRVLAEGDRRRAIAATVLLIGGAALAAVGSVAALVTGLG